MRLSLVLLACLPAACAAQQVTVLTVPSPDGHAAVLYVDSVATDTARLDRVLLAVEGDTTEVFSWDVGKPLGFDWFGEDLVRVWVPIGGNYMHAAVFAEPSSRRVSPLLDTDVAADGVAGTVVTFDGDAFTLRDLWSGEALATWAPPGLDLLELWKTCAPTVTLAGRAATLHTDCADGAQTRPMVW